jgi:hypothetical protein
VTAAPMPIKRASGKSWSQIMRLRSLGLGEFSEIVHEVGDNVLYHSLFELASPRRVFGALGRWPV